MLNATFSVIFNHCVYYFSNVASNKILLSFLMTIEVWKDDCLTFAWCFCIAWRTGSWCTEITRGGEGPNQQHSNNFIFRSIISFPLGIWFNLLKAAIASCQEPKWNCILECTTWCKNINFHAKNSLFPVSKVKTRTLKWVFFEIFSYTVCTIFENHWKCPIWFF